MPRGKFPTKPVANPEAVVVGDKYRITVLTTGLIRFEYAEDGQFEDRASSLAINRQMKVPKFQVHDSEHHLEIVTDRFHLRYDKKPFSPSGFSVQVLGNVTDWKSRWRYGHELTGDDFKIGGTARTLDGIDGSLPLGEAVIQKNGFAMLDDSHSLLFTEDGWFEGRRPGARIDGYLFVYGLDYKDAVKAFYALSGHQPLIPRWALGNWWSRYRRYDEKEYLDLMDQFRTEDIPLSVAVIDMDWHWVNDERVRKSGLSGWTGYSWDTGIFPQPRRFLDELHKRKLRTTLNDHPADGIAPYENLYKEACEVVGQDAEEGEAIEFDITDRKYVKAYFDIVLKKLEDEGVDFWWVDWQQGEFSSIPGVDPLWVLNHFHFLNNAAGGQRPITFSRYAGPGSHRYPVGFSGDTIVTWESLDFQPEFTSSASNIGYGWWSHDIGGHMGGYRDNELTTRWVQYAVFSPLLRLHSSNSSWDSKEPWNYPQPYRAAMVAALRLRHRLVPYIYSMNVVSALHGQPLVQPLYWEHPRRNEAYRAKNCFFFGSELLVAPVTSHTDPDSVRGRVRAFIPPGKYVDIFSGLVYGGDREMWLYRPLESIPVFAKQGSIIPLDAVSAPDNGCENPTALEVLVVVGDDGKFSMYEDDGSGHDVDEVETLTSIDMTYDHAKGTFRIEGAQLVWTKDTAAPGIKRDWKITFVALDRKFQSAADVKCTLGNKTHEVKVARQDTGFSVSFSGIAHNETLVIDLGPEPKLQTNDITKHIKVILHEAQMLYGVKRMIWDVIDSDKAVHIKVAQLKALEVPEHVSMALEEILLADVDEHST